MTLRIAVLMPAFNEPKLAETLTSLRDASLGIAEIVVFLVDDASDPAIDRTRLPPATEHFSLGLARHAVNLGQGATLETARQLALREGNFDAYVTMDSDGQHSASDALAVARAVVAGADVVFGNRFLGDSNVPYSRQLLLRAARSFERALTGLRLGDAHNGLRAFSKRALQRVQIRQCRMAHATEIKQQVSRAGALSIVEIPVSVRYTPESLAKGQRSSGAFAILGDLWLYYLFGERGT